jgi:hypothetical protein
MMQLANSIDGGPNSQIIKFPIMAIFIRLGMMKGYLVNLISAFIKSNLSQLIQSPTTFQGLLFSN